ncbi:uncharacterized protein THITE_2112141 [Thermothielavioides terrestris NRRL 8126]|uniref:Aminoglycoside phosphotransferase domain-containing protein n=2 Tax=Thermothielavioides terrestris TaxID=2587410 RepID=G2R514_THETT|nr:uncharacterized protein THITE_2112141 [Thermothielavioides terrestris NRRL 8126]AEO65291.1 hypothetical protein THITE_2112141 [Thermothielavioides terrestris NRRL 8126]
MMGGQNCHAEITFDDGATWLARFRLARVSSPPLEVRDYILRSEVATMLFLHSQTRVPVPKVIDWATESDPENDVGPGYILMEKVKGKPLDWQSLTAGQKDQVMEQLVDIFLEIEKHPFDRIGSLMPPASGSTGFEIQGIAHHSLFNMAERGGRPLGPFDSSAGAARAIVETYLDMIENGEICAEFLDDERLAHQFSLDIIDDVWKGPRPGERFYLKHPDDKGDHILVDESLNIVGIIDWEWTRTVSREEAFSSPCMMWPVARFYEGSNELSEEELRFAHMFRSRGRDDLAECVLQGRKVQRFYFALGPACGAHGDRKTFRDLLAGLRRAVGYEEGKWEAWKNKTGQRSGENKDGVCS